MRVPWTARRSNQSILKEISPGCSLEGLMLKMKLQYFGHLMLGKIEGRRRRGQQRMRWLDGITDSMDMNLSELRDRGFPDSSAGKGSACNAGDPGLIPGSGRSAEEGIGYTLQYSWASLVAQLVKNPPAIQETPARFLGGEDPLEKG